VLTGGYIGTMEAVSRGAAEAGALVIGVTCEEIEAWRPVRPNAYVQQEIRCSTLRQRLDVLIDQCDAAIALPGGPGTLTEIALLWNQLVIEALPPRPLILVGPGWQRLFEHFFEIFDGYIPEKQRRWLTFTPTVDAAAAALQNLSQKA
jgi:hypothetical protein